MVIGAHLAPCPDAAAVREAESRTLALLMPRLPSASAAQPLEPPRERAALRRPPGMAEEAAVERTPRRCQKRRTLTPEKVRIVTVNRETALRQDIARIEMQLAEAEVVLHWRNKKTTEEEAVARERHFRKLLLQ